MTSNITFDQTVKWNADAGKEFEVGDREAMRQMAVISDQMRKRGETPLCFVDLKMYDGEYRQMSSSYLGREIGVRKEKVPCHLALKEIEDWIRIINCPLISINPIDIERQDMGLNWFFRSFILRMRPYSHTTPLIGGLYGSNVATTRINQIVEAFESPQKFLGEEG